MAEAGDGAEQQASYQVRVSGAATQETDSDSTDAVSEPGTSKDAGDQKSVGEASPVVSDHGEDGSGGENETASQEAKNDELKTDESSSEAASPRDVLKMVYVDESEESKEKPEEEEEETTAGADISEMDPTTYLKEDEKPTNYEIEEEQENSEEEQENSKEKEEEQENRKEEEEEQEKTREEEEEQRNREEEESRMEAEEEDSRTSEEKSSFAAKLSASAANDLDEMMDIGTVDQMEQEALMKEEDEEQNRSPTNTNTVSTLEDGNSAEEEEEGADVKPSASDLMQSSSSPSPSAGSTGRDSSSPAAVVNGMKVVKLSFPRSDSEGQTETEDRKSSPSPPLAKVKDEPVDEEYEQALISSTSTASIKDEPAKDDLRIGSVFSVSPSGETLPCVNPSSIHMSCSNCRKNLLKGQTAFQRKGSPALFCSTSCLSVSLPSSKGATKPCVFCQK